MEDFSHVRLEEEQKQLFKEIVERVKSIPRENRMKINLSKSLNGSSLMIRGWDGENYDMNNVFDGDLEELAKKGFLDQSFGSKGSPQFYVTPEGFDYYEWLMKQQGETIERMEYEVQSFIDSKSFSESYPEAYKKLSKAEELLWGSDEDEQFTTIGHLCREAVQEFADQIYSEHVPDGDITNKKKTINRINEVIEKQKSELGNTLPPFLESLTTYWKNLNDLVQRQEHGAEAEEEILKWIDAKRVVLHTMVLMYEIHQSVDQ